MRRDVVLKVDSQAVVELTDREARRFREGLRDLVNGTVEAVDDRDHFRS